MTENEYEQQVVISSTASETQERIAARKTIVYQTLIDPAVIRVASEENKHKLFAKYLLQNKNPDEIEFVSIEKYYEPFITADGIYAIDYYRKSAYTLRIDQSVREVILLKETFTPAPSPNPKSNEQSILVPGEERLTTENRVFVVLDRWGQEAKRRTLPSGPSENNPEELVEMLGLPDIPSELEVEVVRSRIGQRPADVSRIVSELFEISERALIYSPRFKVKYRNQRVGKEAYMEFDGVTSKLLTKNPNMLTTMVSAIAVNGKRLSELARVFVKSLWRRP